eukprot:TRINITY_DN80953_c0_g1_i1.p1 TRINITY_DN80953_c0_g1~~TRINITY_DN80953_c0_g1_i1.p1  ORF type:complete len:317 (+),score=53.62 TRINITY_DN80953_c0_g1_i1:30-953(+)
MAAAGRRERSRSRNRSSVASAAPSGTGGSSSSVGGVPDWLSDLVAPAPAPAKPLEVPQTLVPMLTDSLMRQVTLSTGAQLNLRQDTRNLGYSLVLFSGPAPATEKARQMLQENLGLTGAQSVRKVVQLQAYHPHAFRALEHAVSEMQKLAAVQLYWPETPGAPIKAALGPAPVAHVAATEASLRKSLREVELELHFRQRRPIPPELKPAKMCKNTTEGLDCANIVCAFCHSAEELRIASRSCFEISGMMQGVVNIPAMTGMAEIPMASPTIPAMQDQQKARKPAPEEDSKKRGASKESVSQETSGLL